MSRSTDKKHGAKPVPLRIPSEMDKSIDRLAQKTGISKADIMRLAIERGLGAVEKMFEPQEQAA